MNTLGAFGRVAACFGSEQSRRWDPRSGTESHSVTGRGSVSNNVRVFTPTALHLTTSDSPTTITTG